MELDAEIEARNVNNETPLHDAALKNSTECVKLIVERGAKTEGRDKDNRIPLHLARHCNSIEAVTLTGTWCRNRRKVCKKLNNSS